MLNGFMVEIDGRLLSEASGFRAAGIKLDKRDDGSADKIETFASDDGAVLVESVTTSYADSPVAQRRIVVRNGSADREIRITRIDTAHGRLAPGEYTLDYFECPTNGMEFVPRSVPLAGTKVLEVTAGRSSRGMHPWFTLRGAAGEGAGGSGDAGDAGGSSGSSSSGGDAGNAGSLSGRTGAFRGILGGAVAWSGNWIVRFEPEGTQGAYRITAGLSNWKFAKTLKPGEEMESVPVMLAHLPKGGLADMAAAFGAWGKRYWYPADNELANRVPATWNHWWPYEDSAINEDVFKANVDVAAELGLEVATLDAGWFGEPDPSCNDHLGWSEDVDWYLKRGDWHIVNTLRFPSGIAALSDYVHAKGLKFGIWCEIEALGIKSEVTAQRPELPAYRDGKHLGYVCLGNPEARDWAFGVLEKLIVDYKTDWLKLDFNLDPGAGCSRTDHGHGEGDGLYEHYRGYYELLSRVREKYPHVYLENCSSGGLRIDLGIARHTHGAFLSDPDFTRHHLQLLWGASMMLHPSALFHFTWSQTIVHYDSNIDKDPIKDDMPRSKFDYMMRANMLNGFGVSYRLPELPDWARRRLGELVAWYKETGRAFVASADMYRLTGQATRDGKGDSWNAYLYVGKGGLAGEALLYAFRLDGGEAERRVRLQGLDAAADYELRFEDGGRTLRMGGRELLEDGLLFSGMPEESSEVVRLRRV